MSIAHLGELGCGRAGGGRYAWANRKTNSGGDGRTRNVLHSALTMPGEPGLLRADSPKGVWEIAEEGVRARGSSRKVAVVAIGWQFADSR